MAGELYDTDSLVELILWRIVDRSISIHFIFYILNKLPMVMGMSYGRTYSSPTSFIDGDFLGGTID